MVAQPQEGNTSSVIGSALLWLFFAYLFVQILGFYQGEITNVITGAMYFILFGIHEASHIIFGLLPHVFVAAAGSLSEIVFTALLVFAAVRSKAHPAAVTFTLLWLMLALTSAGNYMADAKDQLMPLVGMGPNPMHDWHFVFGELNLIDASPVIGGTLKVIGGLIGGGALAWLLVRLMFGTPTLKKSSLQRNGQ